MTTDLPSYFLPRPPMPTDAATLAAFDRLHAGIVAGRGGEIDYRLAAPRWQFLCHLADTKNIVLHGSDRADIAMFEPRKSNDVNEFGDRKAIYAASDGIWPLYFAILDRARYPMSLINSAMRLHLGDGGRSDPYYFFSISREALAQRPYHRGTIYILPRENFEQQASQRYRDWTMESTQWASPVPVAPLARLAVGPEDFPFLAQMRGHDDGPTFARARHDPDAFPWLD
jgi:hypothetical protein